MIGNVWKWGFIWVKKGWDESLVIVVVFDEVHWDSKNELWYGNFNENSIAMAYSGKDWWSAFIDWGSLCVSRWWWVNLTQCEFRKIHIVNMTVYGVPGWHLASLYGVFKYGLCGILIWPLRHFASFVVCFVYCLCGVICMSSLWCILSGLNGVLW